MKALMSQGIRLNGLLGIHFNSGRLVLFLDIRYLILVHSMLNLIVPLFAVIRVILLTMKLIYVLICMLFAT